MSAMQTLDQFFFQTMVSMSKPVVIPGLFSLENGDGLDSKALSSLGRTDHRLLGAAMVMGMAMVMVMGMVMAMMMAMVMVVAIVMVMMMVQMISYPFQHQLPGAILHLHLHLHQEDETRREVVETKHGHHFSSNDLDGQPSAFEAQRLHDLHLHPREPNMVMKGHALMQVMVMVCRYWGSLTPIHTHQIH